MMLRDLIANALAKWKFFRAIAEVATNVPDYDLESERTELTAEELQWIDEWRAEQGG